MVGWSWKLILALYKDPNLGKSFENMSPNLSSSYLTGRTFQYDLHSLGKQAVSFNTQTYTEGEQGSTPKFGVLLWESLTPTLNAHSFCTQTHKNTPHCISRNNSECLHVCTKRNIEHYSYQDTEQNWVKLLNSKIVKENRGNLVDLLWLLFGKYTACFVAQ